MDWKVRIPESDDSGLELGEAAAICFSCGEPSTRQVQTWFEKPPEAGSLHALRTRRTYQIPVCSPCGRLRRRLWLKILGWGGLALSGVLLPIFAGPYLNTHTLDEGFTSPWVLGVGVLLSGLPAHFMVENWRLKDQGGGFVTFVGAGQGFVDLQIANVVVAARVRAALPGT